MRSLLLVAPESAAELARALVAGADALIFDFAAGEPNPSTAHRDLLRDLLTSLQDDSHRPLLYARIGSIEAAGVDDDLLAVMRGEPDGIVLARSASGLDVQQLGAKLAVHEAEYGLADGATGIIAMAGAAAQGLFGMGSYRGASPRLLGLAWDSQALAGDLGSAGPRNPDLTFMAPVLLGRSLTLIAARSAEVAAIDGPSTGIDEAAFRAECEAARDDGFNAKIAATPDQVAIINAVFDRAA